MGGLLPRCETGKRLSECPRHLASRSLYTCASVILESSSIAAMPIQILCVSTLCAVANQ